MAKLLKLRRGTTSQHSSFTGAEGEVTIDTDKDTAVVHDGSTAAGRALAREDLNNVASASITGRLASGAIAGSKIASDAITGVKIANASVTTAKIADSNVTTAKINDDAVTSAKIADNAITSAHIAADTVVAADIAANSIGASELADNAVDTAAIAADAVTGAKIADDAINSEHYADASIDTAHIADHQITDSKLASNAVTTARINGSAVTTAKIADDNVTTAKIAAGAVTNTELGNDCITSAKIDDGAVVTAALATDAVTQAKIADGVVDEVRLQISNGGSNGQVLTKQSGNSGGLTWATISPDGGNAATVDGIDSSSFLRSDAADTAGSDITFAGGAGAVTIAANSDIRLPSGNWSGDLTSPKIQGHGNYLYLCGGSNGFIFRYDGSNRILIDSDGHLKPGATNTYDCGTDGNRWRNVYTNDLNLSNEGGSNDVDGTWGSYTIQEGADELFLINKRNGKKYKFNLTEVA